MGRVYVFLKTFVECLVVWRIPARGSYNQAGAIVSQASSGTPSGAGKTNDALARIIRDIHIKNWKPLFLQGEVASSSVLQKVHVDAKTQTQKESGRYINSHDVALFHKAECDQRGIDTVIVVAFPLHLWRVVRVTEKVGLRVVIPEIKDIPFDSSADQWFCRNASFFVFREILARLFFLLKGYI